MLGSATKEDRMGIKKAQRFCPNEQKLVLGEKKTPNHVLHLLLTIVTAGFWLPIWVLLAIWPRPYRCPSCGSTTTSAWGKR